MNHIKKTGLLSVLILLLWAFLVGCEVETDALGRVIDSKTGLPVAGVHVMEVGVTNKSQRLLCEGYTDSTGSFHISAGLAGFGARKVTLYVIAEKDSFYPASSTNLGQDMLIRLQHR